MWSLPAATLFNRIRGLSPVPSAWTLLNGQVWKIYRSSITEDRGSSATPGTVMEVDRSRCVVKSGRGALALEEVMVEGRKGLGIEEFLRGHPVPVVTILGV